MDGFGLQVEEGGSLAVGKVRAGNEPLFGLWWPGDRSLGTKGEAGLKSVLAGLLEAPGGLFVVDDLAPIMVALFTLEVRSDS